MSKTTHHAVAVSTPADRRRFSAAPGLPPLDPAALDRGRQDESWMFADASGHVCSRCSLWWSHTPTHAGGRTGLIGHYASCDRSAATDLLAHVCARLAAHKCDLAVGPMDGDTWQNYRLVVDRGTEPRFFLEPDNPDDWPGHFLDNGFTILAGYYSALNDNLANCDPDLPLVRRTLAAKGIGLCPIRLDHLDEELADIHALTVDCFRNSLLFTPIGRDEFIAQYVLLRDRVRPELVLLARQKSRLVGYIFAIPDVLQGRRGVPVDTMIIKTLAVAPEYHGAGLGRLLAGSCHEAGRLLGFRRVIHALMLETGAARALSDRIARPMRRYALFARPLHGAP